MEIVCPSCTKRLQVPDEKLPAARQVRIGCPACQERFVFDPRVRKTVATADSQVSSQILKGVPFPKTPLADHDAEPLALVCLGNPEHAKACQDALTTLRYTPYLMTRCSPALMTLEEQSYALLILDAAFDGTSLDTNPVLGRVQSLPMDRRRYMFAVLCGQDLVTMDAMTAYSQGVNLVLNHTDLAACLPLLQRGLAEHERLYMVYRQQRRQLGKDW